MGDEEKAELSTICLQLKFEALDGKLRTPMNEAETRAELIDPKLDGNNKIVIGAEGVFQTH